MGEDREKHKNHGSERAEEMPTRREALKRIAALGLVAAFPSIMLGCGGGDGGDESGGGASLNVAGTWNTTEKVDASACGEGTLTENNTYTVTQDGSNITVTDDTGNSYNGTVDGNQVSWTGSFPENGGTTTITSMTLTFSSDGSSFSGTAKWTWSGGGTSCSGSTDITGTRTSTGGSGYTSTYSSGYSSRYSSGYTSTYSSGYSSLYTSGYYSQYCSYSGSLYYYSGRCTYSYRDYASRYYSGA